MHRLWTQHRLSLSSLGRQSWAKLLLLCLDNLFLMVLKDGKYNMKVLAGSAPGEDFFLILYMAAFSLKCSLFSYKAIKPVMKTSSSWPYLALITSKSSASKYNWELCFQWFLIDTIQPIAIPSPLLVYNLIFKSVYQYAYLYIYICSHVLPNDILFNVRPHILDSFPSGLEHFILQWGTSIHKTQDANKTHQVQEADETQDSGSTES